MKYPLSNVKPGTRFAIRFSTLGGQPLSVPPWYDRTVSEVVERGTDDDGRAYVRGYAFSAAARVRYGFRFTEGETEEIVTGPHGVPLIRNTTILFD